MIYGLIQLAYALEAKLSQMRYTVMFFFVNTTLVIVATNILTHGLYFKCTIFHYAREQCFYIIQYADNLHMHVIDYIQV